jgi:hypothetical protein
MQDLFKKKEPPSVIHQRGVLHNPIVNNYDWKLKWDFFAGLLGELLLRARRANLDGEERLSSLAGLLPYTDLKLLAIHIERARVLRGFRISVEHLEGGSAVCVIVFGHCFVLLIIAHRTAGTAT